MSLIGDELEQKRFRNQQGGSVAEFGDMEYDDGKWLGVPKLARDGLKVKTRGLMIQNPPRTFEGDKNTCTKPSIRRRKYIY
jgi:hypothetical protein